jgi:hypothetical protein
MAGVDVPIEVVGIKDALAKLNKIDKTLRREITRDYRKIVESVVSDAENSLPLGAPISGFNRNWTTKSGYQLLPWGLATDRVSAGVSGKKVKEFSGFLTNLATFYIRFTGPTAVLLDMSGKGKVPTTQGSNMVKGLTEKKGPPSRILWPAYERHEETVVTRVRELVDKVMDATSEELK